MKKLYVFVLLILPAMLVFTAALLHYAHGPYWISYNSDPEYIYLVNSLALAESKQTPTTGHPGTTLQILGAATMKITHALDFSDEDSLEFAVLKNPEFYLTVINIVLITFNTLLLFIIGLATFNLTKNIWLSLLLQFSPFLSNVMLTQGLPRISPEPLLLFASLLFVLILMKMALSKDFSKSVYWYVITLALLSGFGLATKLTFIPLLIIPLFILPKLRNKISFLFLTGFSFVLWTWPIVSQYKILFNWYYRILTHTGHYGLGNVGIINPGIYFQNIMFLFLGNPLIFLIWFFSVGFILIFGLYWAGGEKSAGKLAWQDNSFRILVAVSVAQLFALLIVAKQSSYYYLLPVISFSGFMLFLIFVYLQRLNYFSRFNIKKTIFFAGIFFIFISVWRIYDIKNVFMRNMQIREDSLAVYQTLESEYKDYLKISRLRMSSPIGALAFGNFYINNGLYSEPLQKIYGEAYFFNALNGKFHTWTREFFIEDIIVKGHGKRVVLHGPPLSEYGDKIPCRTGSILHLKDVLGGGSETIYTFEGITLGAIKFQSFSLSPFP